MCFEVCDVVCIEVCDVVCVDVTTSCVCCHLGYVMQSSD